MKVIVIYYSETGNTEKMAKIIAESIKESGINCDLRHVEEVKPEDLLNYDGIVIGSPTYYGLPAYQIKKLLDESVEYHGQLEGKVGGAFSSSANIGGGNETTILAIIEAMLIHGMVVCGMSSGDHYGPVSIGTPDRRVERQCKEYGKKIAELVKKLKVF